MECPVPSPIGLIDRDPAEIVDVKRSGKCLCVRRMETRLIKGSIQDGSAEYEYVSLPGASVTEWTLRKDGRYYLKGYPIDGYPLILGTARYYRDPHF